MNHPFAKMFDTALRKSTPSENLVLEEAEKLRGKGYAATEIHAVLTKFGKGLIDDTEHEIVAEAIEEFSRHIDS